MLDFCVAKVLYSGRMTTFWFVQSAIVPQGSFRGIITSEKSKRFQRKAFEFF